MAEKRGIGVKHNLKFDVKSGSNEEFQGSNAKQDVEEIEFGRNSIVKSDRGVKQLKVDVKSGSGETSKRLIAKDDVKAISFRCYSSRTCHHASGLRGYTSYVASFFNCCNVFRRKGDDGTFDGPVVGSVIFPGSNQEHVSTFNHDNEFGPPPSYSGLLVLLIRFMVRSEKPLAMVVVQVEETNLFQLQVTMLK